MRRTTFNRTKKALNSEPPPSSDDLPQAGAPTPGDSASPPASSAVLEIAVQNAARAPEVRVRQLRPWLSALLGEIAPEAASFTLRFTSDREMRALNYRYRGKDKSTDVLSFPGDLCAPSDLSAVVQADPNAPASEPHLGDVVVAMPTARRQAATADHSVERELRLLTLHGVLHCLGYDHESDDGTMVRLEQRLRRRWLDAEREPA